MFAGFFWSVFQRWSEVHFPLPHFSCEILLPTCTQEIVIAAPPTAQRWCWGFTVCTGMSDFSITGPGGRQGKVLLMSGTPQFSFFLCNSCLTKGPSDRGFHPSSPAMDPCPAASWGQNSLDGVKCWEGGGWDGGQGWEPALRGLSWDLGKGKSPQGAERRRNVAWR